MNTIKGDSIKKNYFYQMLSQLVTTIIPLIIYPYISRIFTTSGLGEYSYTTSIMYYFLIIANLGIVNYGNREIASCVHDKAKLSRRFFEILYCHIISTVFSIFLYVIYIITFGQKYLLLSIYQIVQLIAVLFDVSWFFAGIQKFKTASIINNIFKIVMVIFVFMFVKTSSDIYIYILLLGISNLLGHLLLWPKLKEHIYFCKVSFKNVVRQLKPLIILTIPILAIGLYKYMDKIMIENLSSAYQLGMYEVAEKVITIPLSVITAVGLVMLPKMSQLISQGKKSESLYITGVSMNYSILLAIGLTFGIMAVISQFIIIFFGDEYCGSVVLVNFLTITIILSTWSNTIRAQYLIPNNKDKEFMYSVIIGAIANLIINYYLIPKYAALGAVYGTIVAELIVAVSYTLYSYKELEIKKYIKDEFPYLMFGIIMFIAVKVIALFLNKGIISLIIQILFGATIYLIMCGIYLYIKKDKMFIYYLNKYIKPNRSNIDK